MVGTFNTSVLLNGSLTIRRFHGNALGTTLAGRSRTSRSKSCMSLARFEVASDVLVIFCWASFRFVPTK